MSVVTDKLPAYPDGLDIYPVSYTIKVPKEKLCPLAVATRSDKYRAVFQEVIRRSDALLTYDDDGDSCFAIRDSLLLYLEEKDTDVYLVTKAKDDSTDPAVISTTDTKLMNAAIDVLAAETIAEQEAAARKENQGSDGDGSGSSEYTKEQLEKLGVVMYDHPLIEEMSATDLANLMDEQSNGS